MAEQAKPAWLSDELWCLWERHRLTDGDGADCSDVPQYIPPREAVRRVLFNPRCAQVWRMIEQHLSKLPNDPETRARDCAAVWVWESIQIAYDGPPDMRSHEERRLLGRRTAQSACRLQRNLADVTTWSDPAPDFDVPEAGLPGPIWWEVQDEVARQLRTLPPGGTPVFDVHELVVGILAAIERGGQAWAFTRPPVDGRSSDPRRLWFVRQISRVLRETLGEPMHEHVATLANCLYPTTSEKELDGATVAKLVA